MPQGAQNAFLISNMDDRTFEFSGGAPIKDSHLIIERNRAALVIWPRFLVFEVRHRCGSGMQLPRSSHAKLLQGNVIGKPTHYAA